MVGDARPRGGVGLGGEDFQARIDLIGIRPKNFAVELKSQLDGESGFADPGGAGDEDGELTAQADAAGVPRCGVRRRPWRR